MNRIINQIEFEMKNEMMGKSARISYLKTIQDEIEAILNSAEYNLGTPTDKMELNDPWEKRFGRNLAVLMQDHDEVSNLVKAIMDFDTWLILKGMKKGFHGNIWGYDILYPKPPEEV